MLMRSTASSLSTSTMIDDEARAQLLLKGRMDRCLQTRLPARPCWARTRAAGLASRIPGG